MNPYQEAALTSGGDCFTHFHSEDRRPTRDFLSGLQGVTSLYLLTGNATMTGKEDFVLVDTRLQSIGVTLPSARNGQEREIMKPWAQNVLTILPQPGDTIMLTTGVAVSSAGASLRFKAFGHDWRLI